MAEEAHHHLCKLLMDEVWQQAMLLNLNHSLLCHHPLLLNHWFQQKNNLHPHIRSQAALRYIVRYQLLQYVSVYLNKSISLLQSIYHQTALHSVQMVPKTSTNIQYLYSRGPVRQLFVQHASDELD